MLDRRPFTLASKKASNTQAKDPGMLGKNMVLSFVNQIHKQTRAFQQVLLGGFEIPKNHQKAPVGRSWNINFKKMRNVQM